MSRLIRKKYDELTKDQQQTFDNVVENRPVKPMDGHIGGPFDVWVRSPEMGKRMVGLGGFFRFRTSVDRRYIELAILVTGQYWQAQFEWYAHEPMAREAGVPEEVIQAIKKATTPTFSHQADQVTYNLAREIHINRTLCDETYHQAVNLFQEVGVAELIGLCGFYTAVSMTLNAFDVDLPDGVELPF